ncbi:MAG: DNA-binding protein [Gammaproteobacteria bacterium]|nr:DNA-binding protein [Gammaproteobacteria bacterium]
MSLENLLKIGRLEAHETDAVQLGRLLDSSVRCLDDARQGSITPETRLEAGYRAIMQLSMVALWANGYRPTTAPGHHMTMIQSLVHSVEIDADQVRVLDTFRVKQNTINYTGEDMDITSVEACIAAGEELMQHVHDWLARHRSDLDSA